MCKTLDISLDDYRLGITKIFLKDKVFHRLEGARNKLFSKSTIYIQRFYRGYFDQMSFWIEKESAKLLQIYLRQYLNAADPSEQVKQYVQELSETDNADVVVDIIQKLERLGIRDKNVDIIADLDGVKALIAVSKRFPTNNNVKKAVTRALSRFSNSIENSTKVARSGYVLYIYSILYICM